MKKASKFFLSLIALLSSCAVVMATDREGVDIATIQSARNRMQLIALGANSTSSLKNETGETIEVFRLMKERGSVARAFMHGLLDISTLFAWELAGTPIESALNEKKFFSIRVTFDENEQIKKIELL